MAHKKVSQFLLLLISLIAVKCSSNEVNRKFEIDNENNCFLKDGEPFRYVAGCLHYFRVPHQYWSDRLTKMRAAGLNAVQTYIEWSSHEPQEGVYNFEGDLNIANFFEAAKAADLLVVLRMGPYVCAERDLGGLPYWLLQYNVKLRSNNDIYMNYVTKWFNVLLPIIEPYLYKNGGPIISIQIENEYGAFGTCDFVYTSRLRDMVHSALGKDVILFTTDQPNHDGLRCALIDQTLATIDFGTGQDPAYVFGILRAHRASGPLVNSEFYPGWLDHWGEKHQKVSTSDVTYWLDKILAYNASVAFYMFHGGTSFGFMSGANSGSGQYSPQITSYDYDAPLNEAGDTTDKYDAIKKVVEKYLPVPGLKIKRQSDKMSFGPITLELNASFPQLFNKATWKSKTASDPQAFEYLGARNGLVLYSNKLDFKPTSPSSLSFDNLRDRAYIYVDKVYQGYIGRQEKALVIPIRAQKGSVVEILVENQGRINYDQEMSEHKGIFGNVYLGSKTLKNWDHIYLDDWEDFVTKGHYLQVNGSLSDVKKNGQSLTPAVLKGQFTLPAGTQPADTFLNPSNLTKGFVYLNGKCLGRYWPNNGPQITLYVPGVWINAYPQSNELVFVELEPTSCLNDGKCTIKFDDIPQIDSPVPEN
ncbi:beta-galactosidase-like [Panonychus citri]|uniref:beta-galactosidase-like n=1 Tax=Panonychus citri TaxID=50023 RepID=UPI0023077B3F|nr:beta-galactosidase-like [Panonychus citri]